MAAHRIANDLFPRKKRYRDGCVPIEHRPQGRVGGQIGEEPLTSLTVTPRAGISFSSGQLGTGQLWIGGMYMNAASVIRGSLDLSGNPVLANLVGVNTLNYSVKVQQKENWNLLIGGNWQIDPHWSITAEVGGIRDRSHLIGGAMYRF